MNTLSEVYKHTCDVAEQDNMAIHCSDKGTHHSYIQIYEELFSKYKDMPINILEIGANRGYSLFTWKNYFKNAKNIVGIEYQPNIVYKKDGVKIVYSDINDAVNVNGQLGDMHFDIIIDDGSHRIQDQVFAYHLLIGRLNKNGIYVIEDIQNLENDLPYFNFLPPKVYDLRSVKNRWDDVLFVWENN